MIPTYQRVMSILDGEQKPEDEAEKILLSAFLRANNGETLLNISIDMREEMSNNEKRMKDPEYVNYLSLFILGYAIGQKDFLDRIDGLDLSKITRDDDEQTH